MRSNTIPSQANFKVILRKWKPNYLTVLVIRKGLLAYTYTRGKKRSGFIGLQKVPSKQSQIIKVIMLLKSGVLGMQTFQK